MWVIMEHKEFRIENEKIISREKYLMNLCNVPSNKYNITSSVTTLDYCFIQYHLHSYLNCYNLWTLPWSHLKHLPLHTYWLCKLLYFYNLIIFFPSGGPDERARSAFDAICIYDTYYPSQYAMHAHAYFYTT